MYQTNSHSDQRNTHSISMSLWLLQDLYSFALSSTSIAAEAAGDEVLSEESMSGPSGIGGAGIF